MLLLGILNTQMVLHLLIHEPHLFKYLEYDLLNIIIFPDYIKCFILLLISILPLYPFNLEDIKGHLAHLDGAELRRVGVCCLSDETILVPGVIILALNQLILVLVEFVVQVEEINRCHINLVYVLGQRVSGGYTNVALKFKTGITLGLNAGLELTTGAVIDGELSVDDDILDIDESSIKIV